jgi:hypothetical protein
MSYPFQGLPEVRNGCPMPPYNATNFTIANSTILSTLQTYALTQPQYPLSAGSDAFQIYNNQANVSYFNGINMQTLATVSTNKGYSIHQPYPQFKNESDRIRYRQGQATTAARTQMTGLNPAAPAGVPLSTNYQIITSGNA